jgi:hypothetical protein
MKSLDVALEAMTLLLEIKRKCFDAERLWQVEELVDAALDRVEVIVALEDQDPLGNILEIFNRRVAKEKNDA